MQPTANVGHVHARAEALKNKSIRQYVDRSPVEGEGARGRRGATALGHAAGLIRRDERAAEALEEPGVVIEVDVAVGGVGHVEVVHVEAGLRSLRTGGIEAVLEAGKVVEVEVKRSPLVDKKHRCPGFARMSLQL